MILNISRSGVCRWVFLIWTDTLKLSHNDLERFLHNVYQSIKSTSVGHADNKCAAAILGGGFDCNLKSGNKTLTTFEAKTFHRVEFLTKKMTDIVWPAKSIVEWNFFFLTHFVVLNTLKVDTNPVAYFYLWNMLKLYSNFTAIGYFVCLNDILKFPNFLLTQYGALAADVDEKFSFEVRFSEAVILIV